MKRNALLWITLLVGTMGASHAASPALKVVTTLPDYAFVARAVGADRVDVTAIVRGDQDAHFIRPKPSFVNLVRDAQVLVDTGLDLETWVPTVVDKSGNQRVRSGQLGYVAAAQAMRLLEKPKVISRIEGGLHVYGNPHVTTSPINMKRVARNIALGLTKNDPEGKELYSRNLRAFEREMDRRLFGEDLVEILGGETLCDLAEKGRLLPFLQSQEFEGRPLADRLGGWMKDLMPLRGVPMVTYHKNWVYFLDLFDMEEAGTVEPKPGIPPSTRHVADLVNLMEVRDIRLILAANYFDAERVRGVGGRVGAVPVIVPLYVGGAEGVETYFQLFDLWVRNLLNAARESGVLVS
jgi:ABC-type Zn uptake system ZnuABC Zn-binding protein ZnuA